MASPDRSSHGRGIKRSYSNDELIFIDPEQPVLAVKPLNSVPYSGASTSTGGNGTFNVSATTEQTRQVSENVLPPPNIVVLVEGSADTGKLGPTVGLVDVGESVDSYMFRVAIPGVPKYHGDYNCKVQDNGEVTIEGVTTTGERTVRRKCMTFRMITRNLCPAGRFSVKFRLPGPVEHLQFKGFFGTEGIFNGIVKKKN